jgi:hypothetical protein
MRGLPDRTVILDANMIAQDSAYRPGRPEKMKTAKAGGLKEKAGRHKKVGS